MTLNTDASISTPQTLRIPVDPEHSGIRTAGCLSLFASFVVIAMVLNIFIPDTLFIVGLISLVLATVITTLLDRYLKGRWLSGREVVTSLDAITIQNKGNTEYSLNPQKQINPLLWYFVVKRNGRVKKGWHVVGFTLEQNDEFLPVYTFCSQTDFEKLPLFKQFTRLEKKPDSDMKTAGLQRRLLLAENQRGIYGAEMNLTQFTEYIHFLQTNFPKWMLKD